MDLAHIKQVAEEALAKRQEHAAREPDWLLHHGRRTARLALWLCDQLQTEVDRDVLYVGALLHDIGKGNKGRCVLIDTRPSICGSDQTARSIL